MNNAAESAELQKCCADKQFSQKLKILAVHGYRQNAETFKMKTESFRTMVDKFVEFTYFTAPHKVLIVDDSMYIGEGYDMGTLNGGLATGYEESVKFVEDVFEKEGPFDGILGFSQGACFVGLLCDLQQRGLLKFNFHFAVMASGFKSGSLPHLNYYCDRITLPSLHIFGKVDVVIPPEMSEALSNCFEDPVIVQHGYMHFIPATANEKNAYEQFFEGQLFQKQCREQQTS